MCSFIFKLSWHTVNLATYRDDDPERDLIHSATYPFLDIQLDGCVELPRRLLRC